MDLGGFLSALVHDWIGMMSGIFSLILSVAGFVARAKKWNHRFWSEPWLFWAAGLLCFFIGSAHVWTIEHQRAVSSAKDLERLKYPQLSLKVDETITGGASENPNDQDTNILVIASLRNTGAPSIAEGWMLTIAMPDGKVIKDLWPTVMLESGKMIIRPNGNANTIELTPTNNNLYTKAMIPLQQGSKIRGMLIFHVAKIPRGRIAQKGTVFTLKCKDVEDREVSASLVSDANRGRQYYTLPGLGDPVVTPGHP